MQRRHDDDGEAAATVVVAAAAAVVVVMVMLVVVVVVVVARYFRVNALPRWRPCGTLGQLAAPACARRAAIAAEACGVMYVHARDCRARRPRGRIIGELRSPRFPAGEGKRGRSAHFKRASTATSSTRAR